MTSCSRRPSALGVALLMAALPAVGWCADGGVGTGATYPAPAYSTQMGGSGAQGWMDRYYRDAGRGGPTGQGGPAATPPADVYGTGGYGVAPPPGGNDGIPFRPQAGAPSRWHAPPGSGTAAGPGAYRFRDAPELQAPAPEGPRFRPDANLYQTPIYPWGGAGQGGMPAPVFRPLKERAGRTQEAVPPPALPSHAGPGYRDYTGYPEYLGPPAAPGLYPPVPDGLGYPGW